ncbi:MAG: hypothetical protein HQ526_04070 [Actinobacteria bacterium]|nr:hypothetical protein [Actinomycetota bacterium]
MATTPTSTSLATVARWVLAGFLAFAGVGHFINADTFLAQVPPWLPFPAAIVAISGVIEIALGVGLIALRSHRTQVGWIVAAFFVVIFPGNISQLITQTDAFGLDSDLSRIIRLLFQPLLVIWALWCTGAWRAWRSSRQASTAPTSTTTTEH